MLQLHATCVAVEGRGVLIQGPPGSGKSDLALRLIDSGARLVADDRCDVRLEDGRLLASPPPAIAGLIEARGLGIVRLDFLAQAPLGLVVELVSASEVERLPEPARFEALGVSIPLLRLAPFEASAPAKVRLAAGGAGADILPRR
jgi:serine kinase of HPr protein (carbohydrate metabolism regulator)